MIKGGVYDAQNGTWSAPPAEVAAFLKARQPARQRPWLALGGGAVAAVAVLATLTGNLDDISTFTCKQFGWFCGQKEPVAPVTLFKASLQALNDNVCPRAYLVPDEDRPKALSLFSREDSDVARIAAQLQAQTRYVFVGSRSVELRFTGQDFKGTWPVIPAQLRFEVERIAETSQGGLTLLIDECGGGLDQLIFEHVNLVAAVEPILLKARILDESKGNAPTKVSVKPGETVILAGKINCTQPGTYKVKAVVGYDVEQVPYPEVKSDELIVHCPAEIDALSDLNDERKPQRAVLSQGMYQLQRSGEEPVQ